MSKLNVLFVSAEVTPIAKVGGLADVVGALPKALADHAVDARIIMPLYEVIDRSKLALKKIAIDVPVPLGETTALITVFQTTLPRSKVPVYLVDSPRYFSQGSIYFEKTTLIDGISEIHRFAFFSKAVVAVTPLLGWRVDILHCHDWHTGLVPALVQLSPDAFWDHVRTLYTIHNMGIFGVWSSTEILSFLGISTDQHPNLALVDVHGDIRLLEQGILAAAAVNTVSPGYAAEILTPEYGLGLEGELKKRADEGRLSGILNGIDTDHFNPETDAAIKQTYGVKTIAAKTINKKALQAWAGFAVDEVRPLFGFVGRLFEQKGFDLIPPALSKALGAGAQCVILGSGLEPFEAAALKLERDFPGQVKTELGFNASLAQQIYTGADIFLMPSRYEPCGLGQMIAMRYGTPPIVRATGGLKDTVTDQKTGFVFAEPTASALEKAIGRALETFQNKKAWQKMILSCLKEDFSWDHSSLAYLKLYQSLVQYPHEHR